MIHNTRNNQCGSSIEHTNFCCPFYRVGFSCSCGQCADAWHIKADGEDKCHSLCLGLPPVPYSVFRTPSRDSFHQPCHFVIFSKRLNIFQFQCSIRKNTQNTIRSQDMFNACPIIPNTSMSFITVRLIISFLLHKKI